MFSKSKKESRMDAEQREQFEYARSRINQKKGVLQHFTFFLAGSIIVLIINLVLGYGDELFIKNWSVWVLLIWGFILLLHFFNVFIKNTFMDKEWEDRQMEQLKAKQEKRIIELENKVENEIEEINSEPSEDL